MRWSNVLSLNIQLVFHAGRGSMEHKHKRIHRLLIGTAPAALIWLSSYVASQHLAVALQSGQKINFILLFTASL
jgi:hypothetical protein